MESTAISTRALDLLLLLRGSEPEGLGRADQVSYQIETAILMGILAEGDRLPTESALASELGISPITLRQSLAALRTKGLIETSRGRSGRQQAGQTWMLWPPEGLRGLEGPPCWSRGAYAAVRYRSVRSGAG